MTDLTNALEHERKILKDPRWARIVGRDKNADGKLWYSVATTKIYCRPSCPSRGAKPRNVTIHDSLSSAKQTGFRPCRRCNPDGLSPDAENAAIVLKACRLLEQAEETPSLAELADAAELSPSYFHRLFKKTTGVTPKAYAAECRARRLRAGLGKASTVTAALYDAGFASSGRFYEVSTRMLGMRPRHYRAGGAEETLTFAVAQCSLGAILVASSAKGVAAILLGEDPEALVRDLQDRFPNADFVGGDARYEGLVAKVVGFVESPGCALDLPLDVRGTAFQQRVWQALREIPAGQTATYSDIAARLGSPSSTRAVAGACAANKLAVAIPCHRVIRHDGALSGYRWGVDRKRSLLQREAARNQAEIMDWNTVARDLDAQGWAVLPALLTSQECDDVTALYGDDAVFRSTVTMARHGFGKGEYRYFAYPLPPLVQRLRSSLYPRLAPIANRWNERLDDDTRFPAAHQDFVERCHADGQTRPTPLLLRYAESDYNCLHQDIYGAHVFPLQLATLLSQPGQDFDGGEFVMTEQRPRMQTRAAVVPLKKGDAVVFAVNRRPVAGVRGDYRVALRHGVSKLHRGHRHTLGIIFHDAT